MAVHPGARYKLSLVLGEPFSMQSLSRCICVGIAVVGARSVGAALADAWYEVQSKWTSNSGRRWSAPLSVIEYRSISPLLPPRPRCLPREHDPQHSTNSLAHRPRRFQCLIRQDQECRPSMHSNAPQASGRSTHQCGSSILPSGPPTAHLSIVLKDSMPALIKCAAQHKYGAPPGCRAGRPLQPCRSRS